MSTYRQRFPLAHPQQLPPLPGGSWNYGKFGPTPRPVDEGNPRLFMCPFPTLGNQWAALTDSAGVEWLIVLDDASRTFLYDFDLFQRGDSAGGSARARAAMEATEDALSRKLGLDVDRRTPVGAFSHDVDVREAYTGGERSTNRVVANFDFYTRAMTTTKGVLRLQATCNATLKIGFLTNVNLPLYDPDDIGLFVYGLFIDIQHVIWGIATGNYFSAAKSAVDAAVKGYEQSGKNTKMQQRALGAAAGVAALPVGSDGSEVGYIGRTEIIASAVAGVGILASAAVLL